MNHEELDFILPERQGDSPALGGERAYESPPPESEPDPEPVPTPDTGEATTGDGELDQLIDELVDVAFQAIEQHVLPATFAALEGILDAIFPDPPDEPRS
jgi:hypothetical protein